MNYNKLLKYLVKIMIGGLGLFNSYKLESRYETNTNLELVFQNGMIVSSLFILYFTLTFAVEVLVSSRRRRGASASTKGTAPVEAKMEPKADVFETYEFVGPVKRLPYDEMGAQEFYESHTNDEEADN